MHHRDRDLLEGADHRGDDAALVERGVRPDEGRGLGVEVPVRAAPPCRAIAVKTTMPTRHGDQDQPGRASPAAPTSRSVTATRSRVVELIAASSTRKRAYQLSQKPIAPVIGSSRS